MTAMKAETFTKTLRRFQKRTPFRSYPVSLVSGETIIVDHPETLVSRGGTAIYVAADGIPIIFDHEKYQPDWRQGGTGRR